MGSISMLCRILGFLINFYLLGVDDILQIASRTSVHRLKTLKFHVVTSPQMDAQNEEG